MSFSRKPFTSPRRSEEVRKAPLPANVAPRPKTLTRKRHYIFLDIPSPSSGHHNDVTRCGDVLSYALNNRFLAPLMKLWMENQGGYPSISATGSEASSHGSLAVTTPSLGEKEAELYFKQFADAIVTGCNNSKHSLFELFCTDRHALYVVGNPTRVNVMAAINAAENTRVQNVLGCTVTSMDTWVFSGPVVMTSNDHSPPTQSLSSSAPSILYVLPDLAVDTSDWIREFDIEAPVIHRSSINHAFTFTASASSELLDVAARGLTIDPQQLELMFKTATKLTKTTGSDEALTVVQNNLRRHYQQSAAMNNFLHSAASDPDGADIASYVIELIDQTPDSNWDGLYDGKSGDGALARAEATRKAKSLLKGYCMQTKQLLQAVSDVFTAGIKFKIPLSSLDSRASLLKAIEAQWAPKVPAEDANIMMAILVSAEAAMDSLPKTTTASRQKSCSSTKRFDTSSVDLSPKNNGVLGSRFRATFFKASTDCIFLESNKGCVLVDGGDASHFRDVVWPRITPKLSQLKLVVATHCGVNHIGGLMVLYRYFLKQHRSGNNIAIPALMMCNYQLPASSECTIPRCTHSDIANAIELQEIAASLGVLRSPSNINVMDTTFTLLLPRSSNAPRGGGASPIQKGSPTTPSEPGSPPPQTPPSKLQRRLHTPSVGGSSPKSSTKKSMQPTLEMAKSWTRGESPHSPTSAVSLQLSKSKAPTPEDCTNATSLVFEVYHRGTHSRLLLTGNSNVDELVASLPQRGSLAPDTGIYDVVQVPSCGALPSSALTNGSSHKSTSSSFGAAANQSLVEILHGAKCYICTGSGAKSNTHPALLDAYHHRDPDVLMYLTDHSAAAGTLIPDDQCATDGEHAVSFTFHGSGLCEAAFLPHRAPPISHLEHQRSGMSPRKLHSPRQSLTTSPHNTPR